MGEKHEAVKTLSRRRFLTGASVSAAAGLVATTSGLAMISCASSSAAPAAPTAAPTIVPAAPAAATADNKATYPYPYKKLDPEAARKSGHLAYYTAGCCYGAFHGIISLLAQEVGPPFDSMPTDMMRYGEGGVTGWGTICGALNGSAAAITLVCGTPDEWRPLVNELMGWYTEFEFPSDESNRYAEEGKFLVAKDKIKYAGAQPQNACGSPLCHVSVTEWCRLAGYSAGSPERSERCARLTGDVAAFTVTLLNAQADNGFTAAYKAPDATQQCLACHQPKADFKAGGFTQGKMECEPCHGTDPHKKQ